MAAIDTVTAVLAVGDALTAVVAVGGAVLVIRAALHAFRQLREVIGGVGVDSYDAGGVSAVDFIPAGHEEDYADEQRFRQSLSAQELAKRDADFDKFGHRRAHAEAARMADKGL